MDKAFTTNPIIKDGNVIILQAGGWKYQDDVVDKDYKLARIPDIINFDDSNVMTIYVS
jgi:hypothetical protein